MLATGWSFAKTKDVSHHPHEVFLADLRIDQDYLHQVGNSGCRVTTRMGIPAHDLRRLTQEVKAIEMQQGTHRWWQASELSPSFLEALGKLGIKPPPETWTPWRELAG